MDLAVYTDPPRPKAADTPRKQDFAASAEDPKKLAKVKGSNRTTEAGFCCLCRRPEETRQDQRQQPRLKKQDFAASAKDPMKPAKTKGSRHASRSRILLLLVSEGDFSALIMPG